MIISNKINCPFSFRSNVISRYDGTISVEISAGNKFLEHKHPLKSSIYLLQTSEDKIKDMVQKMIDSDIPLIKIRNYLFNQRISNISTF